MDKLVRILENSNTSFTKIKVTKSIIGKFDYYYISNNSIYNFYLTTRELGFIPGVNTLSDLPFTHFEETIRRCLLAWR